MNHEVHVQHISLYCIFSKTLEDIFIHHDAVYLKALSRCFPGISLQSSLKEVGKCYNNIPLNMYYYYDMIYDMIITNGCYEDEC